MRTRTQICLGWMLVVAIAGWTESAYGLGGRGGGGGGGGGMRGGGGGGGRPGGGFSGGGARPSVGSAPSFSRPSAPVTRPSSPGPSVGSRPNIGGGGNIGGGNIGGGNRPSVQPGTRPSIGEVGNAIGARPTPLPSPRPGTGIGSGAGIGSGTGIGPGNGIANRPALTPGSGTRPAPGIGTRPGVGDGPLTRPGLTPGLANRPGADGAGIANRPAPLPGRLPGLGDGGVGTRLPNQGARVPDRLANLPVEDRRANLNDRMSQGREDWQQHRQDRWSDQQNWRDQHREDWQNWADDKRYYHGGWYHGGWHPGAGWCHMWNRYPAAAALGMTAWAINRIGFGWGYYRYSNPFFVSSVGVNYSEPLVVYTEASAATVPQTTPSAPVSAEQPPPTDEGLAAFEQARSLFQQGDYAAALTQLDTTLKTMPRDTVVHEFRGLVLFALKKYPEASAAIYAVLSTGPGWDWTTMISLYPSADTYTSQVRLLEDFVKANPQSPDGHFLIGYHYQTMGHTDSAARQFQQAAKLLPNDKLLAQLVAMTSPVETPETTTPPPAVGDENGLQAGQLVGNWTATRKDATFALDLSENGAFVWTYTQGQRPQSVKGAFAVDQNQLALETDDGSGTMIAEVTLKDPRTLLFTMIGDSASDPGLQFKKK